MPQLHEIEIGNWFLYIPNGNYCTLKSKGDILELQGILDVYKCHVDQLASIKVTTHILSLCEFKKQTAYYSKSVKGIELSLSIKSDGAILLWHEESKKYNIRFVHQLQNVYYEVTGDKIQPNLYGVKE